MGNVVNGLLIEEIHTPTKKPIVHHITNKEEKQVNCPYVAIKNEAWQIKQSGNNASMNVTSYNGELMAPFISEKGLDWLNNHFKTNDLDIFVDTYVESGTTLCIKLIYEILSNGKRGIARVNKRCLSNPWKSVPWIETDVSQELFTKNIEEPSDFQKYINDSNSDKEIRLWKTHMSYRNLLAQIGGNNEKVIHCLRNPKSVFCSYFDFFSSEPMVAYNGDKNTLFEWFCDGTVPRSNYWDYEIEWIKASKNNENILIIFFEEIIKGPKQVIQKVAAFLNVSLNKKQIEDITKKISFQEMKKEADASNILMNKGTIDRWKSILTKKQSARLDRITNVKFHDFDVVFEYE